METPWFSEIPFFHENVFVLEGGKVNRQNLPLSSFQLTPPPSARDKMEVGGGGQKMKYEGPPSGLVMLGACMFVAVQALLMGAFVTL